MMENQDFEKYIREGLDGAERQSPKSVWNDVFKELESNKNDHRYLWAIGGILILTMLIWTVRTYGGSTFQEEDKNFAVLQVDESVALGKSIFDKKCACCHTDSKVEMTKAPTLCDVTKNNEKGKVLNCFRNCHSKYVDCKEDICNHYSAEPARHLLNKKEMDCIYNFIDNTYENCSPKEGNDDSYFVGEKDSFNFKKPFDVDVTGPVDSLTLDGEHIMEEAEKDTRREY